MYDFDWHKSHGDKTSSSATAVVGILSTSFQIRSALDIACGDGRWLNAFKNNGARVTRGVDGPWTDQSRLLIDQSDFTVHNLEKPLSIDSHFDLAMSLEGAE